MMTGSTRGLREWIMQRVTAVYMAVFIIVMAVYLICCPPMNYVAWQAFFHCIWVQVFSVIFLVGLLWHAWVGIWTIITDYVKVPVLKMAAQAFVMLALVAYFVWGLSILYLL